MKRSTFDGRCVVYAYGAPAKVGMSEHAMGQLRLANQLWNALVEISRDHEEAKRSIWQERPEVAATESELADIIVEHKALSDAIKAAKAAGRSRDAVHPEMRVRAKELAAAKKATKATLKEQKSAAYDILAPRFHDAMFAKNAAVKSTYATFVQSRGLYWPTYNAVVAGWQTASSRIGSIRADGQPAELHFHRFDGSGTWTVQLQRQAEDPERTWATLVSGESKWRNVVRIGQETLSGGRRLRPRTLVSIRVGKAEVGPAYLTVPITLHRPIPPEGDITQIQVTRRRIGTHYRISVAFTVRLPEVVASESPGMVALDLGWRSMPGGSLRVAMWRGVAPHAPVSFPEWMRSWVRTNADGTSGEIVLPADWSSESEKMHKIRSLRDDKLNGLKSEIVSWLASHIDGAAALAETWGIAHTGAQRPLWQQPGDVTQWRSPGRFAALILHWRNHRQDDDADIFARSEAWRRQDRHLYEYEANTSAQLVARRREAYRNIAHCLVTTYGHVVVEDMSIPEVTAKEHRAEESDSHQADAARAHARNAAPGTLRHAIKQAVASTGTGFTSVSPAGTTRVHAACDTWLDQDAAAQITMWCPVCETSFDQDANAAQNLLRLATGEAEPFQRPS